MINRILRPIRMWLATRWFMRHWQVEKPFARFMATKRVRAIEEGRR